MMLYTINRAIYSTCSVLLYVYGGVQSLKRTEILTVELLTNRKFYFTGIYNYCEQASRQNCISGYMET